ncbi:MAG: hypothetical protein WCP59_18180, partial [Actinomycetota bacterium]
MAAEPEVAAAAGEPPLLKRFIKCFLLVTLVMIVPLVVIAAAVGLTPAMAYPFGVMAGMFAATGDGRRIAWRLL